MVRHFLEFFLGTRPKGEMQRFLKGEERKGPAVWPLRTSDKRFSSRMFRSKMAVRRLG